MVTTFTANGEDDQYRTKVEIRVSKVKFQFP